MFELRENFKSQIGIYTSNVGSPTVAQLSHVEANVDYASFSDSHYKTNFFAEKDRTYYIQIEAHTLGGDQDQVGNFQLRYYGNPMRYSAIYESYGGRAGIGVFRPSDGTWYGLASLTNQVPYTRVWGKNGDVPIAADFDGEGETQFAAVRNEGGQKMWYITAGGVTFKAIPWGLPASSGRRRAPTVGRRRQSMQGASLPGRCRSTTCARPKGQEWTLAQMLPGLSGCRLIHIKSPRRASADDAAI